MIVIVGHSNTDNDCLASMILCKYIYKDAVLIRSGFIHPAAKKLYSLYSDYFQFKTLSEINIDDIEKIVIVDTRTKNRLLEYEKIFSKKLVPVDIIDHHINDSFDIENAHLISMDTGANVTIIALKLIEKKIMINREDATIALAGLYADTGNFTHFNTSKDDFLVGQYLLSCNADLKIVISSIQSIQSEGQINIFHDLLNHLAFKNINGHNVVLSFMELPSQQSGISAVVEKVFEIENPDAIFCFFSFDDSEKAIIVGRSKTEEISINAILSAFGGGGHDLAGSAKVKKSEIFELYNSFAVTLQSVIVRARTVADIMSKEVNTIREKWSIKEASIFLESINQTGAPVVNDDLKITGFISLRDIMKARKSSEMGSPVSAYMRKKVITGTPSMNIKEVEQIFQKYNIGHLPILQDDILVGIVTRKDIIESISGKKIEQQIIIQNNDAVL